MSAPSTDVIAAISQIETQLCNFRTQVNRVKDELALLENGLPAISSAIENAKTAAASMASQQSSNEDFRHSVEQMLQDIVHTASQAFQTVKTLGIIPQLEEISLPPIPDIPQIPQIPVPEPPAEIEKPIQDEPEIVPSPADENEYDDDEETEDDEAAVEELLKNFATPIGDGMPS